MYPKAVSRLANNHSAKLLLIRSFYTASDRAISTASNHHFRFGSTTFPNRKIHNGSKDTNHAPSLPSSLVDEKGFLKFNTLHEMTHNATTVFEGNPLFGTFKNGDFQWMSYGDFGKEVDRCRSVLKDLGECYHPS